MGLRRGAWTDARAAFSRAVDVEDEPSETTAEAWAGIGVASYWRSGRGDQKESIRVSFAVR
jgi:hypothetical protein